MGFSFGKGFFWHFGTGCILDIVNAAEKVQLRFFDQWPEDPPARMPRRGGAYEHTGKYRFCRVQKKKLQIGVFPEVGGHLPAFAVFRHSSEKIRINLFDKRRFGLIFVASHKNRKIQA